MKNISRIIATLAIGLIALSCEKENSDSALATTNDQVSIDESKIIDKQKYPGISVENGVLCFESIDYYESILDSDPKLNSAEILTEYLNGTDFKSYGKKFKENSEYEERFMDAIMNEDKIVKIGEWFIYIDMPTEQVLVLSETEENAYDALLAGSNEEIKEFSTGDDVLDHLGNNSLPQDRDCGGIDGGTYPSSAQIYNGISFWSYVKFFRAGVYFRLTGGYESNAIAYTYFNKSMEIQGPQAWCNRRPCESGTISTYPAGSISTGYNNNYVFELYENVRNLNGYYFFVRANWQGVVTNWAGRNVNSPY